MGVSFEPYEVRQTFINGIGKIEGVGKWKIELENIFKSDPLMLKKGLFLEPLKKALASLKKNGTVLRKPADISFPSNDIKSGLQLAEKGFNQFTITNNFRRRAQAFVYKMSYKDMEGNDHTVNSEIAGDVASLSNTKLNPTIAIRDWAGTMQNWMVKYMAGEELEFASTTSNPLDIPLEDNESQAKFKVRIIGPGMPAAIPMTSQENERWRNLSLQTVLFDYMMPILLDAMGHNEILEKMNSSFALGKNLENLQKLVGQFKLLIEAIPAASDALESGDYGKVVTEVFFSIANGHAGIIGTNLLKLVYTTIGDYVLENGSDYYKDASFFDDRLENLTSVLEILDMGLKLVDYLRITKAIADSKTLEEWDLLAREVQLNMDPKDFTIGPLDQKKITAFITTSLADNTVIEYEWSTTGKYGYLWDDRGHKGTSFSSSIKEAYYLCNAEESDLGAGKHTDTIKVTAYLKSGQSRTKIASGTSIANVGKDVFYLAWTRNNGINKFVSGNGSVTYNAGPPSFSAEFDEKENAKGYTIDIIGKDGNILNPNTVPPYYGSSVIRENGKVKFQLIIGRMVFINEMNEAQMEIAKAEREKMLDNYPGNSLKVTVLH